MICEPVFGEVESAESVCEAKRIRSVQPGMRFLRVSAPSRLLRWTLLLQEEADPGHGNGIEHSPRIPVHLPHHSLICRREIDHPTLPEPSKHITLLDLRL